MSFGAGYELLTPQQMYAADAATIAAGTPGIDLMENAGRAVFREIVLRWSKRPVLVLCGPGNNGGDGFVVARLLCNEGWPVRLALLGSLEALSGDARLAADAWSGAVEPCAPAALAGARLIVDALFGAGLSRPVDGLAGEVVDAVNASGRPVVAIDVPSGVDGQGGQARGKAVAANLTVTFCRLKPGHLLYPGRGLCGTTVCADIGVKVEGICDGFPSVFANAPGLWRQFFTSFSADCHKYNHGHALVVSGGPSNTGAARMAAMAALKSGAGLVTIASPTAAIAPNSAHLTSIMLTAADSAGDLTQLLSDRRITAVAIGPAAGVGSQTRAKTRTILASGQKTTLDADALTSFQNDVPDLFDAIREVPDRAVVMTPHEGEFVRLFKEIAAKEDSKWQRAAAAAKQSGAIVVLKGADTVIANPDGRVTINQNAPASLATAGSGDVLTGIITGLLARNIPAFEAACAAVWLHGRTANIAGAGLVAEELPGHLPQALGTI